MIRTVYEGKIEGLSEYISINIKRNGYKFRDKIMFIGIIYKQAGETYTVDYTGTRVRAGGKVIKNASDEGWVIGFRLSNVLRSIVDIEDGQDCKVGVVIAEVDK